MRADNETLLRLYETIVQRYKSLISEKESRSITELRQRCSPYGDFIKKTREQLVKDINIYDYGKHFLQAVEKSLEHIREIKSFEPNLTFWLSFEEISEIKAASAFDKSLLLCALLRALGSESVRVAATKHGKNYVLFDYNNDKYAVSIENCSLLAGEDSMKPFAEDKMIYSFNDLMFESYEE